MAFCRFVTSGRFGISNERLPLKFLGLGLGLGAAILTIGEGTLILDRGLGS